MYDGKLGGGFKMGHSLMYMESFIHIIDYLKEKRGIEARIFSAEYGMKPEVDYHRTKEDCMNAYRYLIQDLGISAKRIVFGRSLYVSRPIDKTD